MSQILEHDLYSLKGRPGVRVIARALSEAERLLHDGSHHSSVNKVARVQREFRGDQYRYATGIAMILHARNLLHLGDDVGAMQCLINTPEDLRLASYELDSQCFSVAALIKKREAHRFWKGGMREKAEEALGRALDAFDSAEQVAALGTQPLLVLNARLNKVYAEGLGAAMAGVSLERNPGLVVEALSVDRQIRGVSAPNKRDDFPALTMIADLAFGGNLSIPAVFSLARGSSHEAACREILKVDQQTWPEFLLLSVRNVGVTKSFGAEPGRPENVARALVIGARILMKSASDSLNEALVCAYRERLLCSLLDVQRETQAETVVTRSIRGAIFQLGKVTSRPFPGRRVFR